MENAKKRVHKLWIGFGIITVISGILLAIEGNYVSGVGGTIIGFWLILQNLKPIREKQNRGDI